MKKTAISLFALLATLALASSAFAQIRMNEIRLDQPGADVDEYIELSGPAGASLAGYALLIIGDTGSVGTCGVLEEVFDLSPYSIMADGYLAIVDGDGAPTLAGYDVVLGAGTLNFENSDNVTFLLVTGFSGTDGSDIDTNNDGVLDSTPWTAIIAANASVTRTMRLIALSSSVRRWIAPRCRDHSMCSRRSALRAITLSATPGANGQALNARTLSRCGRLG